MPVYPWSDLSDLSGSGGGYDLSTGMPLDPQAVLALQALAKQKAAEQQQAAQAQQPPQRPAGVDVPTDEGSMQNGGQTPPAQPASPPPGTTASPSTVPASDDLMNPPPVLAAALNKLRDRNVQGSAPSQDVPSQQASGAPQDSSAQPSAPLGIQQGAPSFAGPFDFSTYANRLTSGVETNGDPNSKDPRSSASGLYSFTDDGWSDFLKSPANTRGWTMADKLNPQAQNAALQWETTRNVGSLRSALGTDPTYGQVYAAHFLGEHGAVATLTADPNAPFVKSYKDAWAAAAANPSILNSNMTNAQALASIDQYFKTARGNGNPAGATAAGTQYAGPGAPSDQQDTTAPRVQLPGWLTNGLPNVGVQDLAQNLQTKPNPADLYLAIGAGLSGAPTLAKGFGAATQNVLGLNQKYQDRNADLLRSQQNAALTGAQIQMQAQRIMPKAMGQPYLGPDGKMYQKMISPATGLPFDVPVGGVTTQQQRVAQGDRRLDQGDQRLGLQGSAQDIARQRLDLDRQRTDAAIDGTTAGNTAQAKANIKDVQELYGSVGRANEALQDIADLQAVLDKEGPKGLTGSSYFDRLKRTMALTLGVNIAGVSPTGLNIAEKTMADLRNNGTMTLTKGSVPRSARELDMLQAQFGQSLTNPDALRVILARARDAANNTLSTAQAWDQITADGQSKQALAPYAGNFSAWRAAHESRTYRDRGATGDYGTTPDPVVQPNPAGNGWQPTNPSTSGSSKPPLSSFWSR